MIYLRRLALSTVAAAAVVAFAAPAMAQAEGPLWKIGGELVGEESQLADMQGTLTFQDGGGGAYINLTCDVDGKVELSNNKIEGAGAVTEIAMSECLNDQPGENTCYAEVFGTGGAISTHGSLGVDIAEAGALAVIEGCYGATEVGFSGTLKGTFNNQTGCIDYDKSGSLDVPGTTKIYTSGHLCLKSANGDIRIESTDKAWYVDGKELGDKLSGENFVTPGTTWSFDIGNHYTLDLSCDAAEGSGSIWNGSGSARMEIDTVTFFDEAKAACEVSFSGGLYTCEAYGSSDAPLHFTSNGGNEFSADGVGFSFELEGCIKTENLHFEGSLEGKFNTGTGCLEFDEATGLVLVGYTPEPVPVSATVCLEFKGEGELVLG